MLYSILISVTLIILVIISSFILYCKNTKRLSHNIDLDLNTLSRSFNKFKSINKKKKSEMDIMNKQIALLRSNIESFNKRYFLSKNQKDYKDIFRNRMIDIELLFTQIKI